MIPLDENVNSLVEVEEFEEVEEFSKISTIDISRVEYLVGATSIAILEEILSFNKKNTGSNEPFPTFSTSIASIHKCNMDYIRQIKALEGGKDEWTD